MKKFKIFFILPLYIFYSCSEDDGAIENSNFGANVILNTTSLSNLDENHTMETTIFTGNGVSVTKMEVSKGTNSIDATISEDKAAFNSSLFGTLNGEEKDGITFSINTSLSSNIPYTKDFHVKITKALSFVKELDAIVYNSSIEDALIFETVTKSAVIDNVSLEWKKGKAGTYATSLPLGTPLEIKTDTINFVNFTDATYGYNLKVKDTLYYRFIATSGTLKDTLVTMIPVISQTFENASAAMLSSDITKNKFNLSTLTSYTDSNTDEAEIKFKSPAGFEKEGDTDIDFVKVGDLSAESSYYNTIDKLFAEKDLLIAKRLYDAGTKETGFSNTTKGDLYIYKVTRFVIDEEDSEKSKYVTEYGMIKIGDIVTTNGGTDLTDIIFQFGEAKIN